MTVLSVRLCGKLLLRSVQRDTHHKTFYHRFSMYFTCSQYHTEIPTKSFYPGRQINKQSAFVTGVLSASFGMQ